MIDNEHNHSLQPWLDVQLVKLLIKDSWVFSLVEVNLRPVHYLRIYGILCILCSNWSQKHKLINRSPCVKKKTNKNKASIQNNWIIFLRSVNLHNWGNSQKLLKASHFSKKVKKKKKLAILLPLWKSFARKTIEKD